MKICYIFSTIALEGIIRHLKKSMRRFLKWYAPRAFDDGLKRCNELGKKILIQKNIENFLDLGCGDGTLTVDFAKILKPQHIFSIEFIDEFREKAEAKGITCSKTDLNGRWPYQSDFFEIILSSQNIEHLHDTRLYLEESYRCLKKSGQLIILTENLSSWINIGSLVFGWQPFATTNINGWDIGNPLIWHIDEKKDIDFIEKNRVTGLSGLTGHVRVLAYQGLRDILIKVGFNKVNVMSTGYLPFWGSISALLCKIDKRHGHFLIASAIK